MAFAYVDLVDGWALCEVSGHDCFVFATQETQRIVPSKRKAIPRQYLLRRQAPSIIWKPSARPEVKAAMEVTMVPLESGLQGALGQVPALLIM